MDYKKLVNKTTEEFPQEQELIEKMQYHKVRDAIECLYPLCCLISYQDFMDISPGNLKNEQMKLERRQKIYQEWEEYKNIFLDKMPM